MAHANAFWPDAVLMAKQSKHKPEAAELLKFMFSAENRLKFAKQRGVIPERIDVGEDPAYLDPADPISKYNAIFVKELESAHNVFETPWPASVGSYVAGYHSAYPLTEHERNAVIPLMLLAEVSGAHWSLHGWQPDDANYRRNLRSIAWITEHYDELASVS